MTVVVARFETEQAIEANQIAEMTADVAGAGKTGRMVDQGGVQIGALQQRMEATRCDSTPSTTEA